MHAEKHEAYVSEMLDEHDLAHSADAAAPAVDCVVQQHVADAPAEGELAQVPEAANAAVMGRGIAEVLFPANPPAPVNARLIKRFGLEDERKPRGLASAAGWYTRKSADPGSN